MVFLLERAQVSPEIQATTQSICGKASPGNDRSDQVNSDLCAANVTHKAPAPTAKSNQLPIESTQTGKARCLNALRGGMNRCWREKGRARLLNGRTKSCRFAFGRLQHRHLRTVIPSTPGGIPGLRAVARTAAEDLASGFEQRHQQPYRLILNSDQETPPPKFGLRGVELKDAKL
jgi:hypothetical protein